MSLSRFTGNDVPEVLPSPRPTGQRRTQTKASLQAASHTQVLILSHIMRVLHLPQPFPRSPPVGVLFFFLLFAPTCFPKSQARLPRTMLTDTQRAGWRWARGAITFRLYLLAPGLPRPSLPLPDQPWLLSRTRGSLSHERHHSVPPRLGAVSPPGL